MAAFATLTELARELAAGTTTSRAIVESCLAHIDARDDMLHAFIDVYREDALALADACDIERRTRFPRSPLHGLPIALKDLFEIKGRPTSAGAASWVGRMSSRTATVVERLLSAGMIPLGKTHMVEFAFGTWGTNVPMGAPWNPWDVRTQRVAGGSSSGSAVAVASGMAPAALGSDTGGSVRIPASLCGLTGLKPTYGLVSLHGAVPLSPTLDSIGPITHTVDDAVLLMSAMAGPDPHDPATLSAPRFDAAALLSAHPSVRGRRVAVLPPEDFPPKIEADVVKARDQMILTLRELGAVVEHASFPFDFQALGAKNGRLIAAEAYAFHRGSIDDDSIEFDPGVRERIRGGGNVSAAEYLEVLAERRRAMAEFAAWMRGHDALLTPTVPLRAIPLADVDESIAPMATFTRGVNYLGACALSLPAGLTAGGLPLGMQIVAAPWCEAKLVEIGRAFQQATDWHRRRPPSKQDAMVAPTLPR